MMRRKGDSACGSEHLKTAEKALGAGGLQGPFSETGNAREPPDRPERAD